jgi:hypothetical protein
MILFHIQKNRYWVNSMSWAKVGAETRTWARTWVSVLGGDYIWAWARIK